MCFASFEKPRVQGNHFFQTNIERNPYEEMLASDEIRGNSHREATEPHSPVDDVTLSKSTTQANVFDQADITKRLTNLSINKSRIEPTQEHSSCEKNWKPTSSSRPLTVDEDDLDLDLELDEIIDTCVSKY